MSFGMPSGFAELIAKKYAIMQQQADTQSELGSAAAGLDRTKTQLMPGQVEADIAQTRANTGLIGENAALVRPLGMSQIGLQASQAGNFNASAGLTRSQTKSEDQRNAKFFRFGMNSLFGS